ncbi:hypothetical protein ARMGADRAFT_823620 [Armillaria gallica]|uniref:Uncharacterized protein n=1 Tax=Armillaria gallica TaxID=47427 RepID=A0A2H3CQU7_ARMGA|nr:hypothetical protein ARMGADRAFT_823620 [Armillaria gallica]
MKTGVTWHNIFHDDLLHGYLFNTNYKPTTTSNLRAVGRRLITQHSRDHDNNPPLLSVSKCNTWRQDYTMVNKTSASLKSRQFRDDFSEAVFNGMRYCNWASLVFALYYYLPRPCPPSSQYLTMKKRLNPLKELTELTMSSRKSRIQHTTRRAEEESPQED